jgi:branched-chain amino acid transport system permease protein
MFGRPNLYTSYESEAQILPTWTQKAFALGGILILFLMPFDLPVINQIPFVRFLGDSNWLAKMFPVFVFAIAALGLNILTGVAGQVSLGHAFFMGVGAYSAAALGGSGGGTLIGWNLPIWIWLPGAGIGAAIVGLIVAPIAVRLRGLYLAIVTLGLVFIGIHFANMNWGRRLAGAPGLGRQFPSYDIRLWKEEKPLVDVSKDGHWFWFDVSDAQKKYLFLLVLMILFVFLAKNIARTRTGRALQAIRDRDIAAEVMGVHEFKYKLIAFAVSSFIAGVAGALYASYVGKLPASQFSLFLSVTFIAILLIGGVGTVAGAMLGTFFVVLMPDLVEEFTHWLGERSGKDGIVAKLSDGLLTDGPGDFGPISVATQTPGWPLNTFDWNLVLYGVLIIVFLIFEPLGLYGIWVKVRNYWKRWPFSY